MDEYRSLIVLACVIGYMALSIGVGVWAIRRTKSAHDFFMAGQNLGPVILGMAVFSTTLSGFGFVGGPGLVYNLGMSSVWMVVVAGFGYSLGFFMNAKRIRMIAEVRKSISLPDILAARYNSEAVRFLTGLTIILGVLGYLATQILAMAVVFKSVLDATPFFEAVPLYLCAAISLAVLVFYAVTGGIIASVYTDLVQGGIMVIAGILVVWTAATVFDGGFAEASAHILEDDPEAIMPWGTLGPVAVAAWFFMFGFGGTGQPHIITKNAMARKISYARTILPIALIGYGVAALLWIAVGVIMRAKVVSGELDPLAAADLAAPEFLNIFTNPLLAGVVFAGLFSAIMSTADAFLNIGAAAAIHDIPRSIRGRSADNELLWARVATIGLSVVALVFAMYAYYYSGELVALLGSFGWGTFAASLAPVVAIGLNWKRATALAASVAIVVALVINFSVQIPAFGLAGIEFDGFSFPRGVAEGAVAMLISTILFIGISLLQKPPKIDEDIDRLMDF
ncbi:MAG: hypothetical protein PVI23_15000 [Maricaulaceae bacterium]|jgi:SSS family transporter